MARILLHDRGVAGDAPSYGQVGDIFDMVFTCDRNTEIADKAEEIATWIRGVQPTQAWYNGLDILCHGLPTGLQLGNRPVTQDNIAMFGGLRGLISTIEIHGCSAAASYAETGYLGDFLCSNLARVTHARVMASRNTQYYASAGAFNNNTNRTFLAGWQGVVGLWYPNGRFAGWRNFGSSVNAAGAVM